MNRDDSRLRIAVVHKDVRKRRVPLFDRLAEKYDTTFFITRQSQRTVNSYDSNAEYSVVGPAQLFSELLEGEFDVIINSDFPSREGLIGAAVAALTPTRLVQWTEVWEMPFPTFGENQYRSTLLSGVSRVANSYVTPGVKWKEYLLKNSDANPEQIFIAPNASSIPPTDGSRTKTDFGVDRDQFVVSYVGRLRPVKRAEDAIKAVDRLSVDRDDVHLCIVGEGEDDYTTYLETLADDLDVEVSFLGWLDDTLTDLYRVSDICVCPSLREAYGLVVVEAMSVGTPVIATSGVGAANEVVVHRENGYVVPADDPLSIYACLSEFFDSPAERERLSKRAEETITERVSYDHMVAGFERAISYATNQK